MCTSLVSPSAPSISALVHGCTKLPGDELTSAGTWSSQEEELHITILKMKLIQLALNALLHWVMRDTLVLKSDNATVMAHVKDQGGMVSLDMCRLAQEIIDWPELHMVNVSARFIPRKNNILANQLSHLYQIPPKIGFFFLGCSMTSAVG